VNQDSRVLRVSSPGFRPEEVAIGEAESLEAHVLLWPSEGTRLTFEGDGGLLESGTVNIIVQPPGEDWVIWDSSVPCRNGVAYVSIPTPDPMQVTLEWTGESGRQVPLLPKRSLWTGQSEMHFRLVPQE
jgi:hypothetical protein